MYQLHYTLDTSFYNYSRAKYELQSETCKILEHYNFNSRGIKFYEILTSENFEYMPLIQTIQHCIRVKLETSIKPDKFLYVEKHFKLQEFTVFLPDICNELMIAEVINPTSHKFVLTLRATSDKALLELETELLETRDIDLTKYPSTLEYCIIDTNEILDYIQTEYSSPGNN